MGPTELNLYSPTADVCVELEPTGERSGHVSDARRVAAQLVDPFEKANVS